METRATLSQRLERASWIALLVSVVFVPLAVSKLPTSDVPLTFDAFAFPQNVLLAVGIGVSLLLWGTSRVIDRDAPVWASLPMAAFGLFALWAGVATASAYNPLRSLLGRSTASLALVQIVAYTVMLFLAVQLLDSRERMTQLSWAVLASSTAVAAVALLQQLFGANVFGLTAIEPWMTGRGFSTIGNPDQLGTFLVLPAVIAGFLFLLEEDRRLRYVAGGCLAVTLGALVGTLTRGAWVAVAIGAVLAAGIVFRSRLSAHQRKRALLLAAVCVTAAAVALLASSGVDLASRFPSGTELPGRGAGLFERVNTISSDRLNVWRSALLIAEDRPLAGTGPAAFELGWYGRAIDPTSGGGSGGIADDPHSIVFYTLATVGIPGLLLYAIALGWTVYLGARNTWALTSRRALSGKSLHYAAWFAATCALLFALLIGAAVTPVVMYSFLGLAVLLRPSAHELKPRPAFGAALGGFAIALACALAVATYPSLAAEIALTDVLRGQAPQDARRPVMATWWNMDTQKAYFSLRVTEIDRTAVTEADYRSAVDALVLELEEAGARQPYEFYYPSVHAQVLTAASGKLGDPEYARGAVAAADAALALMPASIPVRVHKATALSDLGRYDEMVQTLERYWENETASAYPGILYAQALVLSGRKDRGRALFDELTERFPAESASIQAARTQVDSRDRK